MMCKEVWIASNRPFKGRVASDPYTLNFLLKAHEPEMPKRIYFPFWSWKVPCSIIEQCECIGFHSAPLPKGRGGSPIQNMIRLGYDTTEVCMFNMTPKFDDGKILCSQTVSLKGNLSNIVADISDIIFNMITNYENDWITCSGFGSSYDNVPDTFSRITENRLPETDTLKQLCDEIRMRDEDNHPKAFRWHGKYKVDFTNAQLSDNKITAKVEIYEC